MTGTHRDITARKEAELALELRNSIAEAFLEGQTIETDALRAAISEDRSSGWVPAGVVATIGTTSTTAIDPVAEIADVAEFLSKMQVPNAEISAVLALLAILLIVKQIRDRLDEPK